MKHFLFFALLALSAGVTAMLKAEDLPLKFSPAVGNPNPEEIFVIPEEDGSFIVAMDTRMRWPRIRLNFAENSPRPTAAHEGICADIENLDPEREYSIEMAFGGAKGLVTIPPGERRTITVYYSLIAPGDDVVKLPRNLPSGAPDGVAGGKNVDPSEILHDIHAEHHPVPGPVTLRDTYTYLRSETGAENGHGWRKVRGIFPVVKIHFEVHIIREPHFQAPPGFSLPCFRDIFFTPGRTRHPCPAEIHRKQQNGTRKRIPRNPDCCTVFHHVIPPTRNLRYWQAPCPKGA